MSKQMKVFHYDAFSRQPNMGNPAGVVLGGDELTDEEMQKIAYKIGFNETAFPVNSEIADFKIRFFTPGHEMNLCGHATMATVYALKTKGLLGNKTNFKVETLAGILPISIHATNTEEMLIKMQQASPKFKKFKGSKRDLAHSFGLEEREIDDSLPILYGSAGTWTLLVPIKKLESFQKMNPRNKLFPAILNEMPKASVHPFCLETYDKNADMHARHFSSPYSGTIEDPVTGTASGVMGAYYAQYVQTNIEEPLLLTVEQGHEIGKDGRVIVHVSKKGTSFEVNITGNAVYVKDIIVELP